MTWVVADPGLAATQTCRVVAVDVPGFLDEIDYEAIVEAAMPAVDTIDSMMLKELVVLATPRAFVQVRSAAEMAEVVGPRGVASILQGLARERQLVALRWRA